MADMNLSPFCCYYCNIKFMTLEDATNHNIDIHEQLTLKVKSLELNAATGKIGYRTHNFNIIPKDILSNDQKIKVDHSANELSVHLLPGDKTHSCEQIISSPLHKKMRSSVIKNENVKHEPRQEGVAITNEPVSNTVTDTVMQENNAEMDTIISILPSVMEYLKMHGKLEVWTKFNLLLASRKFPINNIAFLLFLDVVKWFDCDNSVKMRYDPTVTKFWRIGYKLFHGKWLRFMSGPKYKGEIVKHTASLGQFDPTQSKVNFIVPYGKVRNASEAPVAAKDIKPGVLTYLLDKYSQQATNDQTFKLCFDGKKINTSMRGGEGDIDLFGFEGPPTITEKRQRLDDEKAIVKQVMELTTEQKIKLKMNLRQVSGETNDQYILLCRKLVTVLSHRLKEVREAKVTKELAVAKFKKMAGSDWRKSNLLHVISGLETILFDINVCISSLLGAIDKLGTAVSVLCNNAAVYSNEKQLSLSQQSNYVHLAENTEQTDETEYRYVKQRTENWFSIRKKAAVTGSTLNKAIGLESLKLQLEHFDQIVYQKQRKEPSSEVKQRMEHGTRNEINGVSTLVGKVLPIFFPDLHYFEEGCYQLNPNGVSMIISPDGSCRNLESDKVSLGIEIKCPAPRSSPLFKPLVHYSLPKYYVPQVLSEMAALGTDKLLYICYTSESTTVQEVQFCPDLWSNICAEVNLIYGGETLTRPTKRSENVAVLREKVDKFIANSVTLLCEVSSSKGIECCGSVQEPHNKLCYHGSSSNNDDGLDLTTLQSWLHECEKALESAYQLTRIRASEFLGFMLSDLDRLYKEEEFHSVPVAYALKGYSLNNQTVREMMEYILFECQQRGLYVPVCSFDGQWHRIAVRDRHDTPLTLLQLQKDVWREVKKMNKNDIQKEILSMNTVTATDFETLCEVVDVEISVLNARKRIIVGAVKDGVKLNVSENVRRFIIDDKKKKSKGKNVQEKESSEQPQELNQEHTTNDIMSALQEDDIQLTDDIEGQVLEAVSALSTQPSTEAGNDSISELFLQSNSIDALFSDMSMTEHSTQNIHEEQEMLASGTITNMVDSESHEPIEIDTEKSLIGLADTEHMLAALCANKDSKNNWNVSMESFQDKFKTAKTIDNAFTKSELIACMQPIFGQLKAAGVKCGKSSPKHELVAVLSRQLGDGSKLERKKIMKKRNVNSLKSLTRKAVSNLSKDILNCVFAEHIFPGKLKQWNFISPFGSVINLDQSQEIKVPQWYSIPEYNSVVDHYLFLVLDSYHQLCGARRLLCQNGIPAAGVKKENIHKIAKESLQNKCGLNVAIAIDLIDKQNVEFAKTTFSIKVVDALQNIGAVREANFCQLMHDWYIAEDEPGISVETRCRSRLALRDWLLEGVNFSSFPPYGAYVKDIPLVLFEGLLTNIERKLQLFPFTKKGCYNVRAVGSMDIENFFGTFQDIDPRGAGVLRPSDIPTAVSVAIELMEAKMDPERGFYMQTSVAKVYPCHELNTDEDMDTSTEMMNNIIDLTVIRPRNHQFDTPARVRGKQKRKKGDVSKPEQPARGIQPVRQHHRRDESKILPHVRRGLNFPDFN